LEEKYLKIKVDLEVSILESDKAKLKSKQLKQLALKENKNSKEKKKEIFDLQTKLSELKQT